MKNLSLITFIAFLFFAVVAAPVHAEKPCEAQVDLQGTVNRNEAKVTNYSPNEACTYEATLAVYDSPKTPESFQWIEAQKLIGSKTVTVKAGQTVTFSVEGKGPSCWNQSDLIRGKDVWEVPYYRDAMDVDVYKVGSCEGGSTPSESPTVTPAPATNATPTPVKSVLGLAKTGNAGLISLLLFSGVASLILGVAFKRLSK